MSADRLIAIRNRIPAGNVWVSGQSLMELLDTLLEDRVRFGTQFSELQTSAGRFVTIPQFNGLGSAAGDVWAPTVGGSSGAPTVLLSPGKINELMPANMFTPLSLSSGVNYIKARCSTNGQWPTSISLVAESSPIATDGIPATGAAPESFDVLLCIVASGQALPIEKRPLTYVPTVVGTSAVSSPGPGQDAYDRLWAWVRQTTDDD